MNLINNNNYIEEIYNIILTKAKYQKIMLVYDDFISQTEIAEIYNKIKEICIFNQTNIKNLDKQELFNGYRVVVYLCVVDSYLKLDVSDDEFINIYVPKDKAILPYLLTDYKVKNGNDYMIISTNFVDLNMIISLSFNKLYNYIQNTLLYNNEYEYIKNIEDFQNNPIEELKILPKDFVFLDVEILKKSNIEYKNIMLVDLILIDAFLCFFNSFKMREQTLVDIYKSAKDDINLINKFYKMRNNETLNNLICLNYNVLYETCLKTKQKILDIMSFYNYDITLVNDIILKVKTYAKNCDNICGYLYLYNVFNL